VQRKTLNMRSMRMFVVRQGMVSKRLRQMRLVFLL